MVRHISGDKLSFSFFSELYVRYIWLHVVFGFGSILCFGFNLMSRNLDEHIVDTPGGSLG